MAPFLSSFSANSPIAGLEHQDAQTTLLNLNIQHPFQSDPSEDPWNPTNLKMDGSGSLFLTDESSASTSPQASNPASPDRLSPTLPSLKMEADGKSPDRIRRVKNGKVDKKKPEQAGKFLIMTPSSVSANAGRSNMFECFESMRTTHKGRKGPLANDTKESALQVRRLGACFCCHSRKVKCDKERPCKNCKRLMIQVPQIVCWQFQDFIPVLFPEFMRSHFRKDEMSKFLKDNIEAFAMNGIETPCSVELFSGVRFRTTLAIEAKFFTPKTHDVLQHYQMHVGRDRVDLHAAFSSPIGLDEDMTGNQRDDLKKKVKEYIKAIVNEPSYVEQVTETFVNTDLPRRVLQIVQDFANNSDVSNIFFFFFFSSSFFPLILFQPELPSSPLPSFSPSPFFIMPLCLILNLESNNN
jgi:hypothetical protein